MTTTITVKGLSLFLAAVLVLSANGHMVEPCVATFYEFEQATVKENPGNVQALVTAFYEVNRPVPLSVQVVYHVTSNGTDTILSTNPGCPSGDELWLWLPSPVYLLVEPTKLNLFALYTLNYFSHWMPRKAHIHVPNICNQTHRRFNFYNDLTSRVQIYAAEHLNDKDVNPGYVLNGCGDTLTTMLSTTSLNNTHGLENLSEVMIRIYVVGHFFLIVVVILLISFFLHQHGSAIANVDTIDCQPSLDNYGLFWGCVVVSVLGNGLLTTHAIMIIQLCVTSGTCELYVLGWMILALLVFAVLASFIVAVYFGWQLPISIPSCFIWPIANILCCDQEVTKYFMKVVRCLSLWSLTLFLIHISARVGITVLALLALPATVLCTLLIYSVTVVCTVEFLAIVFVFCKMKKRGHSRCSCVINICQTVAFAFLFATILCLAFPFATIGVLADYGNVRSSFYSIFSILVTYMAPVALVWALLRIGTQWLQVHMPSAVAND